MSQKYKFGRKKHRNPDSKYAYVPEQLDKDIEANAQRVERKKEHLKEMISVEITRDPIRMEETFSVLIDVLRETKDRYGL